MRQRENTRDKVFTCRLAFLLLIGTLSSAGFYMTMPTLPKYAVYCGMSLTSAGILTGVFSISAIITRPFIGMLADRFSKKRVLLYAELVMCVATFGYSFTHAAPTLYLCRVVHGAAFAGSSTVQLALAADMIPESRRGEGMGYMGMAQILAMSFAPSLGLWLAQRAGYAAMFRASALVIAMAFAGLLLLPCPEQPRAQRARRLRMSELFAADLALLAVMGSLFSMSNGIVTSYLSMLTDERGITGIGAFFAVSSVAVLVSKPVSGRLMDNRGLWVVLLPCFAFGAAAMFLVAGSYALWPLIIAAALKGVAQSSGQSALQAECANRSGAARTGVAMSTCYLGNDLGQGLGNAIGGAMSSKMGYGDMFNAVGGVMLLGFGIAALQRRIDARRRAAAAKEVKGHVGIHNA